MKRIVFFGFVLLGISSAGFFVLSNWQIPAPITSVDKIIPNDTLPK